LFFHDLFMVFPGGAWSFFISNCSRFLEKNTLLQLSVFPRRRIQALDFLLFPSWSGPPCVELEAFFFHLEQAYFSLCWFPPFFKRVLRLKPFCHTRRSLNWLVFLFLTEILCSSAFCTSLVFFFPRDCRSPLGQSERGGVFGCFCYSAPSPFCPLRFHCCFSSVSIPVS